MKFTKSLLACTVVSLLSGCTIYVREDAPVVKYYHGLNQEYHHRGEVRPIRTDGYIGYQDDRGNIHLWSAK